MGRRSVLLDRAAYFPTASSAAKRSADKAGIATCRANRSVPGFMSRLTLALMFVVGMAAGFIGAITYSNPPKQDLGRQIKLLTEENERLHALVEDSEKAKAFAKNKEQREAIEREVAEIRGLEFKTPVDYQVLDRKEIKETLSRKLTEVFSEQEFANVTAAFARLGLLEEGYPLRQKYLDLLGEQVAAFYDQHTHKLFMFEDASLDHAQNRVVLAHELTHALQDQHFGLARLPLEIKNNDDRSVAASALCEGDATLVMSQFMLKHLSLGALKDNLSTALTQNMEQLAKAPRYLREMLIFPYLRGQEFCGSVLARGGFEAVNKAYAQPPNSSAQILHPEKFLETREEPVAIEWPEVKAGGHEPIADNVLGEMGMRILLAEANDTGTAEQAAAGWRGDRYLCFDGGKSLVWKTVWTTAKDAAEFAAAEKKLLGKRYATSARIVRVTSPRAEEVVVIDAADEASAASLEEQFAK